MGHRTSEIQQQGMRESTIAVDPGASMRTAAGDRSQDVQSLQMKRISTARRQGGVERDTCCATSRSCDAPSSDSASTRRLSTESRLIKTPITSCTSSALESARTLRRIAKACARISGAVIEEASLLGEDGSDARSPKWTERRQDNSLQKRGASQIRQHRGLELPSGAVQQILFKRVISLQRSEDT